MAEPPPPEFTVICIDNGRRAVFCNGVYRAQVEASKLYCKTVLQCNPKNIVSIFTMSSLRFGVLLRPTSDLKEIMSALRYVPCQGEGETEVQAALARACSTFSSAPSNMKKRLLMFVGSTISLHLSTASSYGKMLKESGVAVNVFNFYWLKIDASFNQNASVLQGHYHYGREELDTLVTQVDDHGNSHIEDITSEYVSSALDTLSETTLKRHLRYLSENKAAADDEKNKSAADEKNKSVEALELERLKRHLRYLLEKKAAADDEKNKSAADEKNKSVEAPELELERFNEKKENAADDEYGKRFSGKKKRKQKKKKKKY